MKRVGDSIYPTGEIKKNCLEEPFKGDTFSAFADEFLWEIFSQLNLATLGAFSCVSNRCKLTASDPTLWKIAIYRDLAFGNDKWAKWCGEDVVKDEVDNEDFSSLPTEDIIADCKNFKRIFPEKNVKNALRLVWLPKTLNGGLTLKSLGGLVKQLTSDTETGYYLIQSNIRDELENKSIDKSYWALMTKDVLPGSRDESYDRQQQLIAELAKESLNNFEMPEILEATTCIVSQIFNLNSTRLFSDNPRTYTNCKEKMGRDPIFVGGFHLGGLCIESAFLSSREIGVAALRKFK